MSSFKPDLEIMAFEYASKIIYIYDWDRVENEILSVEKIKMVCGDDTIYLRRDAETNYKTEYPKNHL